MSDKTISLVADARLISASDNVIFPLIESMIDDRVVLAVGRYRSGNYDLVGDIAYIAALKEIKETLTKIQKRGMSEFEKMQKESR
jgi:hypothetical protein